MKFTRITRSLFILFLSLLTLTWSIGALTAHAAPLVVGTITQFAVLGNSPNAITTGPDGNLWFTEPSTDQIGRITTK